MARGAQHLLRDSAYVHSSSSDLNRQQMGDHRQLSQFCKNSGQSLRLPKEQHQNWTSPETFPSGKAVENYVDEFRKARRIQPSAEDKQPLSAI